MFTTWPPPRARLVRRDMAEIRDLSSAQRAHRCVECDALLALDQRYCVRCGARRGALPDSVAATIGELREPGPVVIAPLPDSAGERDVSPARSLPTPRAASFAVMAMLAFGVVAGSLTAPGGVSALARTLVLTLPHPAPATQVASAPSAGDSGGGGGGSGGRGRGGVGGGSAPSAPAASAPQQTVTEPASTTDTSTAPTSSGLLGLPPIKHVFVVMLSGHGYNQSFGVPTGHPYLGKTLKAKGELISDYYGVGPSSLANEIALISGQGPTAQTAANCPVYTHIAPWKKGKSAQVLGTGCSYPAQTPTLAGELAKKGDAWKAYIQGIDDGPPGSPKACRHPVFGADDPGQITSVKSPYATWTNPFVYFESVTGDPKCADHDVGTDQLAADLKKESTTPAFSYIAPDPCDNGADQPCATGATAGLKTSDAFLKTVVLEIEKSPAYKKDGLIVITFDQAPQSGATADSSSCCDQPTFANLDGGWVPAPTTPTGTPTTGTTTTTTTAGVTTTTAGATTTTTAPATDTTTTSSPSTSETDTTGTTPINCTSTTPTTTTGTTTTPTTTTTTATTTTTTSTDCTPSSGTPLGGGQVGALLISQYVKPGTVDAADQYNHYSLLKTIEDLFKVKHLGYSNDASLPEFDAAIFNAYNQ